MTGSQEELGGKEKEAKGEQWRPGEGRIRNQGQTAEETAYWTSSVGGWTWDMQGIFFSFQSEAGDRK